MSGGLISLSATGKFKNTTTYFNKLRHDHITTILNRYGPRGVQALKSATPIESGETANSWYYRVGHSNGWYYLEFHNSHVEDGVPIAILIQYGHGTRTGGYVIGRDYINPVVLPIFEQIKQDVFKEVTSV